MGKIYFPKTRKRVIHHCRNCEYNCAMEPPIVGCETIMIPYDLKIGDKEYDYVAIRRTWFNSDHEAVRVWTADGKGEREV